MCVRSGTLNHNNFSQREERTSSSPKLDTLIPPVTLAINSSSQSQLKPCPKLEDLDGWLKLEETKGGFERGDSGASAFHGGQGLASDMWKLSVENKRKMAASGFHPPQIKHEMTNLVHPDRWFDLDSISTEKSRSAGLSTARGQGSNWPLLSDLRTTSETHLAIIVRIAVNTDQTLGLCYLRETQPFLLRGSHPVRSSDKSPHQILPGVTKAFSLLEHCQATRQGTPKRQRICHENSSVEPGDGAT
ncbi:hypothetical protein Bbelb_146910 [Branchiostoma belcheri]|nr:hypothetical protein Bbelb_146910 [Branchiostoma belcheri]